MNHLLYPCRNPECACKVGVGTKHYPYCSADCRRACTPKFVLGCTTNASRSILVEKPRLHRRHGKNRTETTES